MLFPSLQRGPRWLASVLLPTPGDPTYIRVPRRPWGLPEVTGHGQEGPTLRGLPAGSPAPQSRANPLQTLSPQMMPSTR